MLSKIQAKYWALLALIVWGGVLLFFNVLRFDTYGLDEGAALALLVNWTVADNIVNPIVAFGMPDFRALLFLPLGLYWPGSIVAAKVFTLLITFIAALLLYNWSKQSDNDEVALIGSGLLLIAPLTIMQIDQIGVGIYLLFVLGLGCKVDQRQREAERTIGNWYFVQMLLIAITVSLHPVGLAYPAALALRWKQDPVDKKRQQQNYIGIGITTAIILIMQPGWIDLNWFINPLSTLSIAVAGSDISGMSQPNLFIGLIPFVLLVIVLLYDWRYLLSNTLGTTLLFTAIAGLLIADQSWAMVAMSLLLYRGTHYLISINKAIKVQGFLGQRGLVFIVMLVIANLFMQIDTSYAKQIASNILSPEDELFQTLALETENASNSVRIASQWPARTMIAVKHAVLPLPPPAENGESFLKMIKGINYLIFAHNAPENTDLARTLAEVSHDMKTVSIQAGGVIVKVRDSDNDSEAEGIKKTQQENISQKNENK